MIDERGSDVESGIGKSPAARWWTGGRLWVIATAAWWVGAVVVAGSVFPSAWKSDWFKVDYLSSAGMTYVNWEFFSFPAVYGNPAGLGMPYHPGPFYIGLVYVAEFVAGFGVGAYTPLVILFLLVSVGMYGSAVWLAWKSFGPWFAATLALVAGVTIAVFPAALGSALIPGNENLQGPSAFLGLASAAAIARGRESGFVFGAVAFVPLAHAHWGSFPLAMVLLTYTVVSAFRHPPSRRVLAGAAVIYGVAFAPWVLTAVRYPEFFSNAINWFSQLDSSLDSGAADPSGGVASNLGLFFAPWGPAAQGCSGDGCPSIGLVVLAVVAGLAPVGALLLMRERLLFLAALTVSTLPYSCYWLLADPDTNSGPRFFYSSIAVWLFAASFAMGFALRKRSRLCSMVLVAAVVLFPLSFAPLVGRYAEANVDGLFPDFGGGGPDGSVILVSDRNLKPIASALAVGEARLGRQACVWTPEISLSLTDARGNSLSPTSPSSLFASRCPGAGRLLVLEPEIVPPGAVPVEVRLTDDAPTLQVYDIGPVQCAEFFPCGDLYGEFVRVFPSRTDEVRQYLAQ